MKSRKTDWLARVRARNLALIETAKDLIKDKRKPDGTFDEKDLLGAMIEVTPFDLNAARRRNAQSLIDAVARPGGTNPEGQLELPGVEPIGWEPRRLIRHSDGNIVENERTLLA